MPFPNPHQSEDHVFFLTEAQDLLQTIEQKLVGLQQERTTARIHELMRAAHTLKGAAASVGQRAIQEVSHVLEDIFRALYNPNIPIDAEVEALLFEGYECLRRPIAAALHGEVEDESDVMNRAAGIIARLQEKFGDAFDPEAAIPTSAELGFDMVQSMFEVGVTQHLNTLRVAIQEQDAIALADTLKTQAELFLGFAESLDLPGFGAIAQATLAALEAHPEQAPTIATMALEDFWVGREQVLAGDRVEGGSPSISLQQLATSKKNEWSDDLFGSDGVDDAFQTPTLEYIFSDLGEEEPVASITDLNQYSESNFDADVDEELAEVLHALEDAVEMASEIAFSNPVDVEENGIAASDADESYPFWQDTLMEDLDGGETAPAITSTVLPRPSRPQAAVKQIHGHTISPTISVEAVNSNGAAPASHPGKATLAAKAQATIRVALDRLENLNHFIGELLINQNRQTAQDTILRTHVQTLMDGLRRHQQRLHSIQDWADQWLIRSAAHSHYGLQPSLSEERRSLQGSLTATLVPSRLSSSLAAFDALEMDRYSSLHSLIQEALTDFSTLEATAEILRQLAKKAHHTTQTQHRLLTHIRDDLTDVRMAPLESIFNRFPAMLQRLAESHGKQVGLQWVGGDVLVDKAIADKLYDPLLHLIRNAFDHGIEEPAIRQTNGKSPQGKIRIEAYHQGRYTVIEISDDGAGIDPQNVRQQIVREGLATAETLSRYSDSQVFDYLFEPGFSTRQQVSDLSGRGMGLDIVRSQLAAMEGFVQVNSRLSQGTTFVLHIPISLTISKMLVCCSGSTAYALPVERIERILLPKPNTYKIHARHRALQLFEEGYESLIPLRSLQQLLTYSRTGQRVAQARSHQALVSDRPSNTLEAAPYILLLQSKQNRWALQVDRILGEQELVVRPLNAMNPPAYIYGGAILSDNDIALAIDPDVLLQSETRLAQHTALSQSIAAPAQLPGQSSPRLLSAAPSRPSRPSLIASQSRILLVVDDSLTLRQMLTTTLERQGYSVVQAQDGQDAIQKLHGHPQINLVLCDIEMPRLNGFEFLSYSRQHPEFSKIPVVMLTSRTTEKHRQLALGLGATDYITKPYSEPQLLSTLEQTLRSCLQSAEKV